MKSSIYQSSQEHYSSSKTYDNFVDHNQLDYSVKSLERLENIMAIVRANKRIIVKKVSELTERSKTYQIENPEWEELLELEEHNNRELSELGLFAGFYFGNVIVKMFEQCEWQRRSGRMYVLVPFKQIGNYPYKLRTTLLAKDVLSGMSPRGFSDFYNSCIEAASLLNANIYSN